MSGNQYPPNNPNYPPQLDGGYPAGGGYPPPKKSGGMSTMTIVIIIVSVIFLFGLLICGVLAALLIPAVSAAREAATRTQDSNNLKIVGLAMLNYESTYRRFPTPVTRNDAGEEVWSWTVPLLPYIEEMALYDQLDFMNMKPWDDPQNSFLQGPAPSCYQSVRAKGISTPEACHTFVISAPRVAQQPTPLFVDGEYTSMSSISDGTSNTIAAIQLVNHSVPWAGPASLSPEEAFDLLQYEDKFVLILMADGSVSQLPITVDWQTFYGLVTSNGGEVVQLP